MDCVASFYLILRIIEFQSVHQIKPLADKLFPLVAYCRAMNRQYGLRLNNALSIITTPQEAIRLMPCSAKTWFEPNEVMKYWHQWPIFGNYRM
ncbi:MULTISPECIES: hypothetical protein [Okeania]|uniref:hypothetical protein n=1 Tax=Okeania TaxID=1458928 RepID=UPI000F520809|nr:MULTISPECIES: hypothetical protein [Okeania]NEP05492.1 hypothetical protein [Okeania sp. SIO4D6]NEP39746.1 hypothetical protein [Okeania sp. SIO2H7]NET12558.1 hypothetical protein [Okeania sp. SIO1H6]NEP73806.1 hypothetical protein [Okeania sp. SIO2G5]NEP94467.1 hypothetical protein [Okeania sp. SIO2F5]